MFGFIGAGFDQIERWLSPNRTGTDPGGLHIQTIPLRINPSVLTPALDFKIPDSIRTSARYVYFDATGAQLRYLVVLTFDDKQNQDLVLHPGEMALTVPASFSKVSIRLIQVYGDTVPVSSVFVGNLVFSSHSLKNGGNQAPDNADYQRRPTFTQAPSKILAADWGAVGGGAGIYSNKLTLTSGPNGAITSLDIEVTNRGPGPVYVSSSATLTDPTNAAESRLNVQLDEGETRLFKSGAVPRSIATSTDTALGQGITVYSPNALQTLDLLTTQYR